MKAAMPRDIEKIIAQGGVIPAIPLALNARREFDPKRQEALVKYYIDSGADGIAIGVHTTQFAIRAPEHGLFRPVLSLVSRVIDRHGAARNRRVVKVGGICGRTDQALEEARFLRDQGYHAGLLSLSAFPTDSIAVMTDHARKVAEVIPIIGFYLQPSVGGRVLPYEFWRSLAEIENLVAIKIAPFNRYRTLDVVRAVRDAGREKEVTLYTGNDDNILLDLLTGFGPFDGGGGEALHIRGGLLGQWSVWTGKAVELMSRVREIRRSRGDIPRGMLTLAMEITDANAAIFDAAHDFAGCIPGIHEILRRQGLLEGVWCLDPAETLSPGQREEIDRVCRAYPHLTDDDFVRSHLEEWLA